MITKMRLSVALLGVATMLSGCEPAAIAPAEPAEPELPRLGDRPNLNGVWQAIGTAYWDLEAHSAAGLKDFWQLGAIAAVPAGQSVVEGGRIPYLPGALAKREENRAGWPKSDPEAKCYMPGIPRATYMPYPFQIVQGDGDIVFAYEFASANRIVRMSNHEEAPVDSWMGWSNGHWEGDTLVVEVSGLNANWLDRSGNFASEQRRVTERYTLLNPYILSYEATIDDAAVFSEPWTISMPLYRRVEENARLLEFKCMEFAEEMLYGHLRRQPQDGNPNNQGD